MTLSCAHSTGADLQAAFVHIDARGSDVRPPEPIVVEGLSADHVAPEFLELIPRDFARQHLVVSQGSVQSVLTANAERLATAATTNEAAVFNVGVRLRKRIHPSTADEAAIARVID